MSDRRKDAALANRSSAPAYRPVQASIARTIVDADTCSLKRLAWAYGCAPKGSREEKALEMALLARANPELNEMCASWAAVAIEAIADSSEVAELRARVADLEGRIRDAGLAHLLPDVMG